MTIENLSTINWWTEEEAFAAALHELYAATLTRHGASGDISPEDSLDLNAAEESLTQVMMAVLRHSTAQPAPAR